MKTTLVIMMVASRGFLFGGRIEQLTPVGLNGVLLIDINIVLDAFLKRSGKRGQKSVLNSY